jgi:CHAT domain-containing protein/Tfp pilus assembly protein PilF
MVLLMFNRTLILDVAKSVGRIGVPVALVWALFLWISEPPTVLGQTTRTPAGKHETAPSVVPGTGGRRPIPGMGIQITPQVPIRERTRLRQPGVEFYEPEERRTIRRLRSRKFTKPLVGRQTVKLAKQRVPYLNELAMEIERSLMELVKRNPVNAISTCEKALEKAKRIRDPRQEREALARLAHVFYLTGRFTPAKEHYSRSAEISRRLGDSAGEGISLRNLGATLTASGDYTRAERHNLAAFEIFRSQANGKDAQMALNNLGVLEKNRGRYGKASEYYAKALEIHRDPSNVRVLVTRNLGNFFRLWGEYDRAVENYISYGNLASALGDQSQAAEAFLDAGSTYVRQGSYDRALAKFRQALQLQSKIGVDVDWSKKLMGDLLLEMGNLTDAEPYVSEAGYDSSSGWLNLLKSQPETARQHYERLLEAAAKEQNLDEMFTAYTGLGRACEAMGDYPRAQHHYSMAIGITEEIRTGLLLSERRNFFSEKINGFVRSESAKGLVRVALKQNNPVASIYPAEVTKAREFADNLSQKTDGYHFNVPQDLLEKEAELTNKLASLRTALNAVPKADDNRRWLALADQIKQDDSKRKEFIETLCGKCRDYCSVKYPRPTSLRDSSISDAEYVLLLDVLGDSVGIRLLKGKRVIESFLAPWNAPELEKQVRKLRDPFEQVQLTKFSPELAAAFYQRLLANALKTVPAGTSIIIVPDGPLALVPFEALVARGRAVWKSSPQGDYPAGPTYVGDLYSISYYQSLTAMKLVRTLGKDKKSGQRLLVMTDPIFGMSDERLQNSDRQVAQDQTKDVNSLTLLALETAARGTFSLRRLEESEKLGKELKELLGANCEVYTGLECTKRTFLSKFSGQFDQYSAVVFGTHGFAANDLPGIMEPVLALTMVPQGTDGFLTMSEVAGLAMNVNIAALTACKTGLGMRLAGEGVLSMGRAFQSAGAESVIMSLWSVAEQPSIRLMEEFFKGMKRGNSKLTAWTNARAQIRKEGFEHPFFWASFIMVGEPY